MPSHASSGFPAQMLRIAPTGHQSKSAAVVPPPRPSGGAAGEANSVLKVVHYRSARISLNWGSALTPHLRQWAQTLCAERREGRHVLMDPVSEHEAGLLPSP